MLHLLPFGLPRNRFRPLKRKAIAADYRPFGHDIIAITDMVISAEVRIANVSCPPPDKFLSALAPLDVIATWGALSLPVMWRFAKNRFTYTDSHRFAETHPAFQRVAAQLHLALAPGIEFPELRPGDIFSFDGFVVDFTTPDGAFVNAPYHFFDLSKSYGHCPWVMPVNWRTDRMSFFFEEIFKPEEENTMGKIAQNAAGAAAAGAAAQDAAAGAAASNFTANPAVQFGKIHGTPVAANDSGGGLGGAAAIAQKHLGKGAANDSVFGKLPAGVSQSQADILNRHLGKGAANDASHTPIAANDASHTPIAANDSTHTPAAANDSFADVPKRA